MNSTGKTMNQNKYENVKYNTIYLTMKDMVKEYNLDETSVHNFIYINGIDMCYDGDTIEMTHFTYNDGDELPGYLSSYYWECILDNNHTLMGKINYNTSSPHAMWLCGYEDDEYETNGEDETGITMIDTFKSGDYMSILEFNIKYMDDCECDRCGKVWNKDCIEGVEEEHSGYVCDNQTLCGLECLKLNIAEEYESDNDLDEEDFQEVCDKVVESGYIYEKCAVQSFDEFSIESIEEGGLWDGENVVITRAIMV
tara:strand:+ start:29 stop:790 length:762 start_codon:yes stop_codon:yes gene_type:complete